MTAKQIAFLGFAILILVPLAYFLFRGDGAVVNYPPKNQIVVAFGDSLVEGVGANGGGGFVSIVSSRLGIDIVNKGKAGDTTEMGLARIDEVLAEDPGVVILLLGGNDALRRVPKETTFQNLSTMIERFQAAGAVVVLLGVRGGILGDGYKEEYDTLAKKYHTAYVSNVLDGLIGDARYMYDGIHPNDIGYQMVADRVVPVLARVLR